MMPVELNHTIVSAHDKQESATFLAEILGLAAGEPVGPFVPVTLANGVTLDFMDRDQLAWQHFAFLVDDQTFDACCQRLLDRGTATWADPAHERPGEIGRRWGGRGVYFRDPAGHDMELMTCAPG